MTRPTPFKDKVAKGLRTWQVISDEMVITEAMKGMGE
jgi:hypothetical protein